MLVATLAKWGKPAIPLPAVATIEPSIRPAVNTANPTY